MFLWRYIMYDVVTYVIRMRDFSGGFKTPLLLINKIFSPVFEKSHNYVFLENHAALQLKALIASCLATFKVKNKTKTDNELLKYPLSSSIDSFSISLPLHSFREDAIFEIARKGGTCRKAWHEFAQPKKTPFIALVLSASCIIWMMLLKAQM